MNGWSCAPTISGPTFPQNRAAHTTDDQSINTVSRPKVEEKSQHTNRPTVEKKYVHTNTQDLGPTQHQTTPTFPHNPNPHETHHTATNTPPHTQTQTGP